MSTQYVSYSSRNSGGGGGGGVTTVNGLSGAVTLAPGSNIIITPSGNTLTIASTASGGITSINSDTTAAQLMVTATTGSDFTISTSAGTTTFAIPSSSASNRGLLSSSDWSTFNAKQSALTIGNLTDVGTDGIVITGGSGSVIGSGISIAQHVADASHNGYLSSVDWATFNAKQPAGSYATISLNNLASTAVNADIIPGSAGTISLGSGALPWQFGFFNAVKGSTSSSFIDLTNGQLRSNSGGALSVDYVNRNLVDSSAVISIDYQGRNYKDPTGTTQFHIANAGVNFPLLTASNVPIINASNILVSSTTSSAELAFVHGVTSNIQTQINAKLTSPMTTAGDIIYEDATPTAVRLPIGSSNQLLTVSGGLPAWVSPSFASSSLTNSHIFVGNGSNVATDVAVSGDLTLANTGAFTIANNSVSNAKLAQAPSLTIKGNNTGGTANELDLTIAQVNSMLGDILADGSVAFTADQSMGSHKLINVTDPTVSQDAATKNYVDMAVAALQPLASVYAASTANISGTYLNGAAGVGATFTTTATTTFTLDGATPPLNSRILIKDQSSGFQNGVYSFTALPVNGVSGAVFTRSLDYNTAGDMNAAGLIPVINGTVNALSSWQQVAFITTVGTDSLVFTEFTANPSLYMLKANNLSDVASASTSFINISPLTTAGDLIYENASPAPARLPIGSSGNVLTVSGGLPVWAAPATSGTVTSVALADGSSTPIYTISGSPVTSSGTLTLTLNTEAANSVFAGPTSGGATQPTFRSLVAADVPTLSPSKLSLTQNHILVGNASNVAADVAMSGDISIVASGATTVAKIQGTTVSGTTGTTNVVFSASPTLTGTITAAAANFSGAISASNFSGTSSGTNTGDQTITLTGDVTGSGTGSFAATITNNSVTNAKLAQMAAHTYKGNNTGSTANALDVTSTQLTADLNLFTTSLQGLTPSSGGGTSNFLRADGTWAVPPGSSSGTVTSVALTVPAFLSVSGSPVTTSGTLAVSFSGTALPIANGGTAATTKTAAFDSLSPMTTGGDIIYGGASGTGTRLANGTSGQVLTSNGGTSAPSWGTNPSAVTNNYFSGYMSSSSSWSTTSNTFNDGTNSGGNTLTTLYSNGLTITAGASNVAGITFTPSSNTATYKISALCAGYNSNANNAIQFRITDSTTVFGWNAILSPTTAGVTNICAPVRGIYTPGTTSAVTVKIQIRIAGGTANFANSALDASIPVVQWEIVQISA